jgi:3-methyladenine DNA glycosylase AlkC
MSGKSRPLMKDGLGPAAVDRLATALAAADPGFPAAAFRRRGRRGLDGLELKERVHHLVAVLEAHLPAAYPAALKVVQRAARRFPPGEPGDALAGFAAWPLVDWVPTRGLKSPAASLEALRRMTSLFSAEFAIRPFILADPAGVVGRLRGWTDDPDEHVRRLVSEGTRPRLPWGARLPVFVADPAPVLELLEALKDDRSEYVRRSVANNLNDVAKDHPDLAARTGARWLVGAGPERRRLVRHGLRTLVKDGHGGALRALGFTTAPRVEATLELDRDRLAVGESLAMTVRLRSTARRAQNLVVDYAIHHLRATGRRTRKVFKLKVLELGAGEEISFRKNHSFAPRSVRRYYAGRQEIELLVGGRRLARVAFDLSD